MSLLSEDELFNKKIIKKLYWLYSAKTEEEMSKTNDTYIFNSFWYKLDESGRKSRIELCIKYLKEYGDVDIEIVPEGLEKLLEGYDMYSMVPGNEPGKMRYVVYINDSFPDECLNKD